MSKRPLLAISINRRILASCAHTEILSHDVQVEQQQADKLNFVMLNVDNNAWTGEKREYRVSGIPHFVFLDDRGQARGAAIGKLPKQVQSSLAAQVEVAFSPHLRAPIAVIEGRHGD